MKYNLDSLIQSALFNLSDRQKDVLNGRYGLGNGRPMTLASIGNKYQVTRERIRQVEALALQAINNRFNSDKELVTLVAHVKKHLDNLGGLQRETALCEALKADLAYSDEKTYAHQVRFLLESCGAFGYHSDDADFHSFWYTDKNATQKAESLISKLVANLKNKKDDIIGKNQFDKIFDQVIKAGNYSKPLALNYISISKKFASNAYNDFGLSHWPEITPKTSRDWAYLVLRKLGLPLHFTELTSSINQLRGYKKTNPQTVHNELIKDGRFILVGRGTYGLKEFNLMAGTAREVITQIINKKGPQKSKDLIRLVLAERIFKENTLLLNLQDRKYFQRLDDGRYTIKKV